MAFLAMVAGAARGLATLMTEFLRIAASMTSVLLVMLIIIVLAVILLSSPLNAGLPRSLEPGANWVRPSGRRPLGGHGCAKSGGPLLLPPRAPARRLPR